MLAAFCAPKETATGEATEKSSCLDTSSVESVCGSALKRLHGGKGVHSSMASLCGVGWKGYSGWERSPTDAS